MGRKPFSTSGDNKNPATLPDRKVFERIGHRAKKNMEWLLLFNEADLNRMSTEEWSRLQAEILAFMQLGLLRLRNRGRSPSGEDVRRLAEVPFQTRTRPDAIKDIARKMQGVSRQAISEFLSRGRTVLPRIPNREIVRMPSGVFEIPQQTRFPEFFFLENLANVLVDVGSRLFTCSASDCPRTAFVKTRRNQCFCSNTCRSRIAIREWRNRKRREKDKKKSRKDSAKRGS